MQNVFLLLLDAAKGGGHHAAKNGSGGSKAAAADAVTRKTGMTMDEAMNILNITKEADLAKIAKVSLEKRKKEKRAAVNVFCCSRPLSFRDSYLCCAPLLLELSTLVQGER